jgi:hypothetical protein
MANYIKFILTTITGLIFVIGFIFLLAGYRNVRDLAIRVYSIFMPYEENLKLKNPRFINDTKLEKETRNNINILFIGDSHFVNMLFQKPLYYYRY